MPYAAASGRLPLQRLLGVYLDTASDDIVLADTAHGRPELDGAHRNALRFNWSHSGGRALVAIARSVQPGIDLEYRLRRNARDVLALAQRFFAPQEALALAALPTEQQGVAFLRLWTIKEAVLKAEGRGLAYGLHRVVVDLGAPVPTLELVGDAAPAAWQARELSFDPDWLAAIAWRGPALQVRWCGEWP